MQRQVRRAGISSFFFLWFFFLWPRMLFRSDLAHHVVIIEISNCYVICSTYLILLYQYSIIMYGETSQMAKCWEFFLRLFHFFIFVKCAQQSNNLLYCYEREPVLRAVILFNLTLWLPWVTKKEFFLAISIQYWTDKRRESRKNINSGDY